jgi:tRNA G18 (ribose-2'-O)-methylase SpoU
MHHKNALSIAKELKEKGYQLIALEQSQHSIPISKFSQFSNPVLLIVGNELTGVDPALLEICDAVIEIPMRGVKRSLNVEVAFAIAASALMK